MSDNNVSAQIKAHAEFIALAATAHDDPRVIVDGVIFAAAAIAASFDLSLEEYTAAVEKAYETVYAIKADLPF